MLSSILISVVYPSLCRLMPFLEAMSNSIIYEPILHSFYYHSRYYSLHFLYKVVIQPFFKGFKTMSI